MSRKGSCFDNAVIENFFGHLKEELFDHVRCLTIYALTTACTTTSTGTTTKASP
jgi:putative transposase